jgi:membrane protease YdiL (CAAX protease family)
VTAGPAPRELVATWAAAVAGIAAVEIATGPVPILHANAPAAVAAFLFLALPDRSIRRAGERWTDHGLPWWGIRDARTWRAWGRGASAALAVCAVVFPLFLGAFWAFGQALPSLPPALARALAPYGAPAHPALRLPDGIAERIATQLLVVALPEELFYRGWMQEGWARSAPSRGVSVLGARLGAGFVWTQALFAAGHLVVLQPWRLGTFFPGLLFGWLRARTGDVAAPVVAHALSNLFLATLERSFYG